MISCLNWNARERWTFVIEGEKNRTGKKWEKEKKRKEIILVLTGNIFVNGIKLKSQSNTKGTEHGIDRYAGITPHGNPQKVFLSPFYK